MDQAADSEGLTYEKASKIRVISSYVGSALLILVCILKIISVADAPPIRIFITCFYLIALAVIMSLVEFGHAKASQFFLFLSYGWGKGVIYAFLIVITLSNSKVSWLEYIICALFAVAGGFNVFIGVKFK